MSHQQLKRKYLLRIKNIYGIRNFTLELISTNNTVKSRNLLDKSIAIARTKGSINSSGLVVSNANYYNIYIKIKPNTQYHLNAGYENSSTFWFVKEGYPLYQHLLTLVGNHHQLLTI